MYFADDWPDKMHDSRVFLWTVIGDKIWVEHSENENIHKEHIVLLKDFTEYITTL